MGAFADPLVLFIAAGKNLFELLGDQQGFPEMRGQLEGTVIRLFLRAAASF